MSVDGIMVSPCCSCVYVGGNQWGKTVSKQDHLIHEEGCYRKLHSATEAVHRIVISSTC